MWLTPEEELQQIETPYEQVTDRERQVGTPG
jgi:hypothetical protein